LFNYNSNINENLDTFYCHIDYVIKNYTPKSRIYKLCFPIWFSYELKCIIKEKKAHSTFKILKTTVSYTYFSNIRKKFNYLRYRDYKFFINKTQQSVKLNPKSFWNFYRLQKSINQLPSSVSYNEKEAYTGSNIVNLFREHFSNVYKKNTLNNSENFIIDKSSLNLYSVNIFNMDVFYELWSIKLNLSSDPNDISPRFFKETSFILSDIITFLFNKSLQTGAFPDKWKTFYVTPIFKKGDRSQVSKRRNYFFLKNHKCSVYG